MWFDLADQLGMSPRRAKVEHTSSDLEKWLAWRKLNINVRKKEHFYFAQLAALLHRLLFVMQKAPDPGTRTEDMLIEITYEKPMTPEEREKYELEQMEFDKASWGALMATQNNPDGTLRTQMPE